MVFFFRLTFILAFTSLQCAAFGQSAWSELPYSSASIPGEAASTPWSSIVQMTSLPPVAMPNEVAVHCDAPFAQGYENTTSWTNNTMPPACNGQLSSSVNCGIAEPSFNACRPRNHWHISAAGLIMGRSKPSRVWTTYEANNNPNQLMRTDNAAPDWEGGFEFHIGRKVACDTFAVDFVYWKLGDLQASTSQTHANFVSTPLLFNDLEFGTGDPVQNYFDTAEEHRISRRDSIQNVELNFLEVASSCGSCSCWRSRKSIGVRYFQFNEDLLLSTLDQGGTWGGNGGANEVIMSSSIENRLIGVQLGYHLGRQWGERTTLFIAPKLGIYNNHIEHRFDLRRGDGVAAMPTAFSGVNGSYPVESTSNVVSFLTEVNLGFSWQATCNCSLFTGYRVVALTGMGLADSQIPQYIVDLPEIADINHQDSLVLHGAFFGVAYSR